MTARTTGKNLSQQPAEQPRALYIHIPFCERKCEYCDFVSVAGARGQHEYVAALSREITALGHACRRPQLSTVFCGGGTPGLLDLTLMGQVMQTVHESFEIAHECELTLEANPSSTSVRRGRAWRAAGFTRVSVGVQSTHADVLGFLGRVHDSERALTALRDVREAGFASVSADLIYAVPGLDDRRWEDSLREVVAAEVDHVSCYELTVETGTPLHRDVATGRTRAVDPDAALRQHRIAVDLLAAEGYEQYEVSNFARPGQRCAHNLVYWRDEFYAAAGVGAHSHLPVQLAASFGLVCPSGAVAFRHDHGRHLDEYIAGVQRDPLTTRHVEWIDAASRREERLMLGLRLREGVELAPEGWAEAGELERGGFIEWVGGRVRATPRGEEVLNQLVVRLLGDSVHVGSAAATVVAV